MKLSTILETLAIARLPSVTTEQLQQLVGTAEGKAFAEDLRWFAAGETGRRDQLAAVVHSLAPGVQRTVEQLGFQFDLPVIIGAAQREGAKLFDVLRSVQKVGGNRSHGVTYLESVGLKKSAGGNTASAPGNGPLPYYYSFKIFACSAALCVAEARTRTGNLHTIQIEGAVLLAGSGRKTFDWQNKIIIQLTVQEAYQALAIFENKLKSVKFDGHGNRHDKSLHIEFQANHYFVKIIQRGRPAVAVQVRAVDALQIVSLIYKQIRLNEPHLEIDQIRAFTDQIAQMTESG